MVDVERVLLERNVPIPLRDGTLTYANVWRPAGGDPVPAIMVRTPYTKEVEEINVFSEPRVAAVRGFAIVSQDVRGRGESEGEFDPYFQEGADGYDSIEHVAGLDWCSGDVVMAGNSYVGRDPVAGRGRGAAQPAGDRPGAHSRRLRRGLDVPLGRPRAGVHPLVDRRDLRSAGPPVARRRRALLHGPRRADRVRALVRAVVPRGDRVSLLGAVLDRRAPRRRPRPRALDRRLARHVPRRDAAQLRRRPEPPLAPDHRAVGPRRLADPPRG